MVSICDALRPVSLGQVVPGVACQRTIPNAKVSTFSAIRTTGRSVGSDSEACDAESVLVLPAAGEQNLTHKDTTQDVFTSS